MGLFRLQLELLGCAMLLALLTAQPTLAQVIPDNTLPNNSIVQPDCTNCDITGGTTVGANLFHSFQQFSIPTGGSAYFDNAATIENIISRVTGPFRSDIDGLIRANPAANLFLINPNGIVFGPNASLDIRGSLIATTARSLIFADGTQFSAVNPQAPLLTISITLGLQFGQTPNEIRNESLTSLSVDSGKTLALIGGPISLPGGILIAPAGRVELGSVADNSFVKLTAVSKGWEFNYEGVPSFQDIRLSQAAFIDVSGDNGGDIQIQGRQISLSGGSQVVSVSRLEGQAGNLGIKASNLVELIGSASDPFPTGIFNEVEGNSTGTGRALTIATQRLVIQGGAQVSTKTLGTGQGVALTVIASESAELMGNASTLNLPSGLFARVDKDATGDGGMLFIQTERLIVRDGAQISTDTFGSGRAGNLSINASNSIELAGRTTDNQASALSTQVGEGATGDAGELMITTSQLTVKDGAQILTVARSGGNGGALTVNATDSILLSGASPSATALSLDSNRSGIFVSAELRATGSVGNLRLTTDSLTVENGARISADNIGSGEGGSATLNVGDLVIREGGQVRAGSFDAGPGGILTIRGTDSVSAANSVQVIGQRTINAVPVPSELFTDAQATGTAGNLNVTTTKLEVRDGARLTGSTSGAGQAGTVTVTADSLEVSQGGQIRTSTASGGNAGDITLMVSDRILLTGQNSGLFASTALGSEGKGGSIDIDPRIVLIQDGATIAVDSQGSGIGGNITLQADRLELSDRGSITAETASAQGGNITLNIKDLLVLRRNSSISATAGTAQAGGNGGNVKITAPFVIGVLGENSDITANAFTGNGGRVDIFANAIYGLRYQLRPTPLSDITASSEFGTSGSVTLNLLDIDPNRGLVALPVDLVDPSRQIAQTCAPRSKQASSSFVVTGRGGLPPAPGEKLRSASILTPWGAVAEADSQRETSREVVQPSRVETNQPSGEIVETQGWIRGKDGTIVLVAQAPTSTPYSFWSGTTPCDHNQLPISTYGAQ